MTRQDSKPTEIAESGVPWEGLRRPVPPHGPEARKRSTHALVAMPKRFLKHLHTPVVSALDEEVSDFSRLWFIRRQHSGESVEDARARLLDALRARWRFDDPARQELVLPIALTLHRYGWAVADLAESADLAMQAFVARVQPRAVERLAPKLRELLTTEPQPLRRRPAVKRGWTQFREGDVLSIRLRDSYHAAHAWKVSQDGQGSQPILRFYDAVYGHPPTIEELRGASTRGEPLSDGRVHDTSFGIYGLRLQPDPADQVAIVEAGVARGPDSSQLAPAVALWTVTHLFDLGRTIDRLWGEPTGG